VVAASDEDAARFRSLYRLDPGSLVVIPNGYDETAVRPPSPEERSIARAALALGAEDFACLFVGSDVPHNRAALAVTLERVMPPLARDGFKLLVVGSVTRAIARRREPWLIAHPATSDLGPWLHAADAGLNPMTHGGGSNVKLPTYLAAGLAAVSTRFGVRGYAALEPLVLVAEIARMSEALRARPRGTCARGEEIPAVVRSFAWGTLGERLAEAFERRLLRGQAAPALGAGPTRGAEARA
jgi:hypothetical protein